MYKVEIVDSGITVFRFKEWKDAVDFVGLAIEAGINDGKPVAVTIEVEERGLN